MHVSRNLSLDLLHSAGAFAILARTQTTTTMLMSINTNRFLPAAVTVAPVKPRWHEGVSDGLGSGSGSALAERWMR
jgi:hypothetical protein